MNINTDVNSYSLQTVMQGTSDKSSKPAPAEKPVAEAASSAKKEAVQELTVVDNTVLKESIDHKAVEAEQEMRDNLEKQINASLKDLNFGLSLNVDERTNRMVARITDKESGQVVKEIPPQELLDLAAKLKETVEGMLFEARG
ncbi:MAG: flagellar protein FlaG [Candidatus Zophobacter franzmannii]|nr:flagellar protein FlaG [Candidatus Zophobacter franzmannii]